MTDNDELSKAKRDVLEAIQPVLDRLNQRQKYLDQPNHPALAQLAADYAKRDFWQLRNALNMAAGYHPDRQGWGRKGDWSLASACVGPDGSLRVVNPNEPFRKWRVRPAEFLTWATKKGIPVHSSVRSAVAGKVTAPVISRTTNGTEKRKLQVEQRQDMIEMFIEQIDQLTADRNWDSSCMPVNWKDAHRVFYLVYPNVKYVSSRTLSGGLIALGAHCTPGRKSPDNRVLYNLFGV